MAKIGISGDIIHSVGVRYRVRGSGAIRTTLFNMGEITSVENSLIYKVLEPINMATKSNREKTILSNFKDQGIQILFRTKCIDEIINLSKITMFFKPVAESFPIKSDNL